MRMARVLTEVVLASSLIGGSFASVAFHAVNAVPGRAAAGASCSTASVVGRRLGVKTSSVSTPASPNGIVSTADGQWSFSWLSNGQLGVFSDGRRGLVLTHTVPMPATAGVNQLTLTQDGQYLLAASGYGALVVSVARAERGNRRAVIGALSAKSQAGSVPPFAINVAVQGIWVFVSVEFAREVAVFNLRSALAADFRTSGLVGTIPIGGLAVGLALSPDGRWLYATSEGTGPNGTNPGAVSVINAATAERSPAKALVATAPAEACGTVRDVVSADGATLWVTARDSNQLIAFSTSKLRDTPERARVAAVPVGRAPVGLALAANGARVITADELSNGLTVVDTAAALASKPAVLGTVAAGMTPRDITVDPHQRAVLVTNRQSRQVEAVPLAQLP